MKNLFIEMPTPVHQKLKDLAYVNGVTMKDYLIRLVEAQPDPEIKRPATVTIADGKKH